jgi:dipeptidyl-peptidase-4
MRRLILIILLGFVSLTIPASTIGQEPAADAVDPARVTLERLFGEDRIQGDFLGPVQWLNGSAYTTVDPSLDLAGGHDIVEHDARTGGSRVLVSARDLVPESADQPLAVQGYTWSDDFRKLLVFTNSRRVWRENTRGDFWVFDRETGELTQLGGDAPASTLMFAKFSPDASRVGYVRENNVYVETLATGQIAQLTTDGSRTIINGTFDWVYEEELDLQDGWRWSPDGQKIAYWQLDASGVRDFLLINNTDSLYSYTIPIQYPKAGSTNSAARVGVVGIDDQTTRWLDVPGDARNNYIARMDWAANSDEVVIQHLNRLQNTLQIMLGQSDDGAVKAVYTERDSAWVDMRENALAWLGGGEEFVWISEIDGWRHAHVVSRDGTVVRTLTPGPIDIIAVEKIDVEGGWLYYLASPDDAVHRYLFRASLDGSSAPERLTPIDQPGSHSYDVAPGGEWAIHTWSSFGNPPVTDLVHLPDHAAARTLVANTELRAYVNALDRGPMEFFQVDAGDVTLDGWIMKPPDFDASQRYPVLFYVYGEPWGQTVRDAWGGGAYLWHLLLTQQGYLVASLDPRGTPAPRGREWRKTIYKRLGTLTSADLAAGVKEVFAQPYVDPSRVAIWGWSGGGSQSLNAIFRYPDVFGTAMAVAPVPDIRLYDTIYQERYMGLPQDEPEAYESSSPLTFADRLEGNLLLVHGTGDDNVHYQGTERLINALVEANKPFSVMVYPNRSHGIFEGQNTTLHLYSLLTRYLKQHVEPGPKRREISSSLGAGGRRHNAKR